MAKAAVARDATLLRDRAAGGITAEYRLLIRMWRVLFQFAPLDVFAIWKSRAETHCAFGGRSRAVVAASSPGWISQFGQ